MAKAKKVEKTNNKNLITIVLLIVAGIVILGYTNSTGRSVSNQYSSVKISPNTIYEGEVFKILLESGKYGYDDDFEIYKVDYTTNSRGEKVRSDNFLIRQKISGCSGVCKKDVVFNYKSMISWKGTEEGAEYYIKVYDKSRERAGKTGEDRYMKYSFFIKTKEPTL